MYVRTYIFSDFDKENAYVPLTKRKQKEEEKSPRRIKRNGENEIFISLGDNHTTTRLQFSCSFPLCWATACQRSFVSFTFTFISLARQERESKTLPPSSHCGQEQNQMRISPVSSTLLHVA